MGVRNGFSISAPRTTAWTIKAGGGKGASYRFEKQDEDKKKRSPELHFVSRSLLRRARHLLKKKKTGSDADGEVEIIAMEDPGLAGRRGGTVKRSVEVRKSI